ncbi:indole-3-acetate O-methyltransferase 1 [Physcomitrium patens]|uniref:Jasmonate O-methyltransferase n=1 Tax=Physcomitrium patens TaxID=3218 RepID=A0A2K1KV84_PHYPA|nr:indole-3-acetate O-methyltransferase 1-like [Physcomitrium patens]PNR57671.1 hypothetical protein PHYPA_004665 [Physcomitrium patens]|eukprot:XP_024370184.1 indole-3-acetate O-methyltransferase 1-like [Physcomitrella patens]
MVGNHRIAAGWEMQVLHGEDHEGHPRLMKRKTLLRMQGGDGEGSYSRNSGMLQGGTLRTIGHNLADEISQLGTLTEVGPVRVADFGCSSGANALEWADLCASSIVRNYHQMKSVPAPEIQHFFSDLPSNDFNSLFRELVESKRPYFAAAAPGSFHGRLFPQHSIQIAISIWSLHWMSKIPETVLDASSPAYNKGQVWLDSRNPSKAAAYSQVARHDLLSFFTHRACELEPGGIVSMMCMSRGEHEKPELQCSDEFQEANPGGGLLEQSWEELIAEGVISPKELDTFNIPVYHLSIEEIKEAIDQTSAFEIKQLEVRRDHL